MELIRQRAFARAGLVGNPSDGYNGCTLSVIVRNFWAEVVLYEWEEIEIILSDDDRTRFGSIQELQQGVKLHGYYGGVRLVKATIKGFVEYCQAKGLKLHDRNFSIRYQSNIPRAVGLAGSSAIIVATLRALMKFYRVEIPLEVQPSLALGVETKELGIAGGLQDRVIQCFEGLVYMDFSKERERLVDGLAVGAYEPLPLSLLPNLYVAYCADAGEPTEVTHGPLKARYQAGDVKVHAAMRHFAELAQQARQALLIGDHAQFGSLMNENFDTRRSICDLSATHIQMIETARSVGVPAKFAGSGGAIVGTYPDDVTFALLTEQLEKIDCRVIKPMLCPTK